MKQLLLVLLLCPLFALSQHIPVYDMNGNVTYYRQDTIKIPIHAAKSIVKELVSYDSLKAIHKLTVDELILTKEKVAVQSSIIKAHEDKGIMYEQRIFSEQEKFRIQSRWTKAVVKENKRLKVKLRFIQITGTLAGGFLTYLYITK
jgi:hypothetical protein